MQGASLNGMVLFGHGARDARWAEPFEQVAELVRMRRAALGIQGPVTLAYLELMQPDLATAIAAQASAGCGQITVVPLLLGRGAHLRRDLPALLDACRLQHPHLRLDCATAAGEDPGVLAALAEFALRSAAPGT